MDLSTLLKTLADANRLRILAILDQRTLCVCDIEAAIEINQSNLSRHLNRLRHAGLVQATKKGMFVYYQRQLPTDPATALVLDGLYSALPQSPQTKKDKDRLDGYLNTKHARVCD